MNLIVAVDENWGIGCKGKLLQSLPQDMKFFREHTMGKVVVMGRTTFESLPGRKPLKNRVNIVISSGKNWNVDEECKVAGEPVGREDVLIIVSSIDALLAKLEKFNDDDVYVIGGESIYRQLAPLCKRAYITKIFNKYDADTWMQNLDDTKENSDWELVSCSETKSDNNIKFSFCEYRNRKFNS